MNYDAVIFDLFGTLVDMYFAREYARLMAEMSSALGVPCDDFRRLWMETYSERATGKLPTVEASIERVCKRLGVGTEGVAKAAEIRCDYSRRTLRPRAEALETLAGLKQLGLKLGLISGCTPEIPLLWPETPFAEFIDVPVFSCDVGLEKPDPRIYHLACQRLEVEPQRCLYVGDGHANELTGASNVGMRAVLIALEHEDDIYGDYHPEADTWRGDAIDSLKKVLKFLETTE